MLDSIANKFAPTDLSGTFTKRHDRVEAGLPAINSARITEARDLPLS